jgi:hypothetical protein
MAAVVRARALQGLPGVLTRLGADPAEYFQRFAYPSAACRRRATYRSSR